MPSHRSVVQGLPSSVQAPPALPAGWIHAGATELPLHTSVVHGLPSLVQAVPAVLTVSAGQVLTRPSHASVMSHSFTAARHTVPAGAMAHCCVQQGSVFLSHCGPLVQLAPAVPA